MSDKNLEQKFLDFYNSKYPNDKFTYGAYPDEINRAMFMSGYELAQKEMQEKLDDAIEVIKFYANTDNWEPHACDEWSGLINAFGSDECDDNDVTNDMKGGKRARDFLKTRGE